MKAVGIKQLKARLSEYIRLARAGETILVTDREEVVAELGPSRHRRPPAGSLDEVLDRMAEAGVSPEIETRLNKSVRLMTSRLSSVESARAFLSLRRLGELSEGAVADAESVVRSVWMRCEILELSESICDLAERVAPGSLLQAQDALHLASFVVARRHVEGLELLTVDERLRAAVQGV